MSTAADVYILACERDKAECAGEFLAALEGNERCATLSARPAPLSDRDVGCIAEALRALQLGDALRVLNLEENAFGLQGVKALMEAVEDNPGHLRELRLGRNNLKDQAAVVIGHALTRGGCGLRVLDLSENGLTKMGLIPIAAALQADGCDLVELSFHNNSIDGEAAVFLAQTLARGPRLRHLHLGFNVLRDAGAVQLARGLPFARHLSTLDLTANRIGAEGGAALAAALTDPQCALQRLNLRHNLLDDATLALFAGVVRRNTSLIQLFLGFMTPSADTTAAVLDALRFSRTLLLLDIFGWRVHAATAQAVVRDVLQSDTAVAAIVSDACDPLAAMIDAENATREDQRGAHPIYVGPDDRDAYLATKSLKRYSRAQSRRQSRATSRDPKEREAPASARTPASSSRRRRRHSTHRDRDRGGESPSSSHRRPRSHSHSHSRRRSSIPVAEESAAQRTTLRESAAPVQPQRRGLAAEEPPSPRAHATSPPSESLAQPQPQPQPQAPQAAAVSAHDKSSSPQSTPERETKGEAPKETAAAAAPSAGAGGEARSSTPVSHATGLRVLQGQLDQQQELIRDLQRRVRELEGRRECRCQCGPAHDGEKSPAVEDGRAGAANANANEDSGAGEGQKGKGRHVGRDSEGISSEYDADDDMQVQRPARDGGGPYDWSTEAGGMPNERHHSAGPDEEKENTSRPYSTVLSEDGLGRHTSNNNNNNNMMGNNPHYVTSNTSSFRRQPSAGGMSGFEQARPAHRSLSRMSAGRAATPDSGARQPGEAALQRSASISSYPPQIEPSPAQDSNRPRRKSISQNI